MKVISSTDNVRIQRNRLEFQFEYTDGTKEQFRCPLELMQNFMLTIVGQSEFTPPPPGDSPYQYKIFQADASGRIAIELLCPGNKKTTLALERENALQLGKALVQAASDNQ